MEPANETETQIEANIRDCDRLRAELGKNEAKTQELARLCEQFKNTPDLQELACTLVEQLNTTTLILLEIKAELDSKLENLRHQLEELKKAQDASLENTLDSSSMPIEEIPIHAEVKKVTEEFIAAEVPTGVTIETQTGASLSTPPPTKDVSTICKPPNDVEIQTHLSESEDLPAKESITISKTVKDGQETIQIATKSEPQPIIEEPDDLLVQADYKNIPEMSEEAVINILHAKPNQPFETVFVEPDETTTEVIVDADGTKRIIVKKLQRTVVRQQQTLQQQQRTVTNTLTEDGAPVSESFSQITLQGQQSSTATARGDGRKEVFTTQSYSGKVVSGAPGSEVTVHEFKSDPESKYSVVEGEPIPEIEVQGVKLHQGDITFVDDKNLTLVPVTEGNEITTSSSSVRAVVQQVTRRVIRRTRRIIRKIVVIDGKEQVTEEVIEEPEEVEFTEEGIPRVSINVTRTEDGKVVQQQQFGEPLNFPGETQPEVHVTHKVTSVVLDADGKPIEDQRYVLEPVTARSDDAPLVAEQTGIVSEPSTEITVAEMVEKEAPAQSIIVDASKIEKALRVEDALSETAHDDELKTQEQEIVSQPAETSVTITEISVKSEEASVVPKDVTAEFLLNEKIVNLPEVPQEPISTDDVSSQTTDSSKTEKSKKKKRKLKGKTQPTGTPRVQTPEVPPEDNEEHVVDDRVTTQSTEVVDTIQVSPVDVKETVTQELISLPGEQTLETTTIQKETTADNLVTPPIKVSFPDTTQQENWQQSITDFITNEKGALSPSEAVETFEQTSPKTENFEFSQEPETPSIQSEKMEEAGKAPEIQTVDIDQEIKENTLPATDSAIKPSVYTVEFELSLEEKRPGFSEVSPKVDVSIKSDEIAEPSEKVKITLPSFTEEKVETIVKTVALTPIVPKAESDHSEPSTPSDIDHGGRKSKKKKKKGSKTPSEETEVTIEQATPTVVALEEAKDETPIETVNVELKIETPKEEIKEVEEPRDGSIETTLGESTEIIISDSQLSDETPKPTMEIFEQGTETTQTDGESMGGYEADKTTVDESFIEDDRDVEKRKRKKKKKQKVKPSEAEDTELPLSTTEASAMGESVQFTDEESVPYHPPEDTKKPKKRKKGKKSGLQIEEAESKPEDTESEETVLEAHSDQIVSPADSYKTLSSPSEPATVKIVEESLVREQSESPKGITSEMVTTVPVIEAVITQESLAQTSPEVCDITEQFIKQEAIVAAPVPTEQVSIQTTPEIPTETAETSIQTIEIQEEQKLTTVPEVTKPEVSESCSQVEIETSETVTQTLTPEKVETVTTEIAIQTASPEKAVTLEESSQTLTPEVVEAPEVHKTDSSIQTAVTESQEESIQTITPDIQQKVETLETETQAKPYDISTPPEHSVQTSPVPSAPPLDEIVQTSPIPDVQVVKTATVETVSQTQPVVIHDLGELTPPSSSSEQYEIHIQASLVLPPESEKSEVSEESVKIEEITEITPASDVTKPSLQRLETEQDNIQVAVSVDGRPAGKGSVVTDFLNAERKPERRKRKYPGDKPEPIKIEDFKSAAEETTVTTTESKVTEKPSVIETKAELITTVQQQGFLGPEPSAPPIETTELISAPVRKDVKEVTTMLLEKEAAPSVTDTTHKTVVEEISSSITDDVPSTTVKVSITIPPEVTSETVDRQPDSLTSELSIDTTEVVKPKTQPKGKKSKSKSKSVPIEEVLSPTQVADTPITPSEAPLSPPDYSQTSRIWETPVTSEEPPKQERLVQAAPVSDLVVKWTQAQAIERAKNLQNASRTTHLSDVLYLATLNEIVTDESIEERNFSIQQNLNALREAVIRKDVEEIQQTVITTVQTITTWLETIEYRIYLNRQQTADGPSKERVEEFGNLKDEIVNIENNVEQLQSALQTASDVYNEDDRQRIENYIDSLQRQIKVIEEVTEENEQLAAADLVRWDEFIQGVKTISRQNSEVKKRLDEINVSDASPQSKLNDLDSLENVNRSNMTEAANLITVAKGLMRDFPGREIPQEAFGNLDFAKQLQHNISVEREKVLQLLSLADEYEQTLKDFSQIIDIADVLVESPISVRNLEHLEEEMQNHRKFFVNLSHCRAILESLEENLDSETRALHSDLHQNLYERSRVSLEKATGRFQQMSLAASRWTVLEQGMKEEMRWLQVAQQRVPDLSSVTSADYDQYINLYQSLSLDIAHHHAKLSHLNGMAQKLQELVVCPELEESYVESMEIIKKLQDDVQNNLRKLISFRDLWGSYNVLSDKLEVWLKDAEYELRGMESPDGSSIPAPGQMRQFWVSYIANSFITYSVITNSGCRN